MKESGAGFSGSCVIEVLLVEARLGDREVDAVDVVPQTMEENTSKAR